MRDYFLIDYYFAHDRVKEEKAVHYKFYEDRLSEGCKIEKDAVLSFFKTKKQQSHVPMRSLGA